MTEKLQSQAGWKWYGFAGHHICGARCQYHLTTSINGAYLVSTVGRFVPDPLREPNKTSTVGSGRDFETFVFAMNGDDESGDPIITSREPVDTDGYTASIEAERGHYAMCQVWATVGNRPTKCDGNHGGPRCADPECWNDEATASQEQATSDMQALVAASVIGLASALHRVKVGNAAGAIEVITKVRERLIAHGGWSASHSQAQQPKGPCMPGCHAWDGRNCHNDACSLPRATQAQQPSGEVVSKEWVTRTIDLLMAGRSLPPDSVELLRSITLATPNPEPSGEVVDPKDLPQACATIARLLRHDATWDNDSQTPYVQWPEPMMKEVALTWAEVIGQAAERLQNITNAAEAGARVGAVPEGWKLVPVEPTPKMVGAFADSVEGEPAWDSAEQHDRDDCIAKFTPCYRAMLTAAPQAPALDAGVVQVPDECPHVIWFDDADMAPIVFAGAGAKAAAEAKFKAISGSWNASLFVRIASNSQDDPFPSAAMSTKAGG